MPGWLGRLSIQLRPKSWSHSAWVWALRWALYWHLKAWSQLQILCFSLPLCFSPSCALSFSKINKYTWTKIARLFPECCTILHSHQQLWMIQFLPIFISIWCYCYYFICSERWDLIMVLICISLMAYDVEHLFMCLFAIFISFLMKYLFMYLAHLLIFF